MNQSIARNVFLCCIILFVVMAFETRNAELVTAETNTTQTQAELPLGIKNTPEYRTVTPLTEGVWHTKIISRLNDKKSFFTVDAGFYESMEEAKNIRKELQKDGYRSSIHTVKNRPGATDIRAREIGYVVQTGNFKDEAAARPLLDDLKNNGYEDARISYTGYDGTANSKGPLEINIIETDAQQFKGDLNYGLANNQIKGKEKLTDMSKGKQALAAINGGYFVVGERDGIPGDPAGISVKDGMLLSEAVGERTSLILNGIEGDIAKTKTSLTVEAASGESSVIDGINRMPGVIRSCGGVDDHPTNNPRHDVTCTDDDELILFNDVFGAATPEGQGVEVILDESDIVVEIRTERGNEIPEGGSILSATGKGAEWLSHHAVIDEKLSVTTEVYADGSQMNLDEGQSIINGAPRLLKDGRIAITADKEGFNWSSDFYYRFALYRHPRTLVGIKENGNLLFVTVDGRNPDGSIGLSFLESAELLKSLGAVDGMNLDGGGSTTMVINDALVNDPSDSAGERPIADGIFILE
ncbi:phosphodiester glycosidase family protein [Jeotgalibacillus sp. S-D1]|uniref:phosphodiester glycosidase family protein n=1 Tax=Jeotgalibacillus sp. S-D1 TaxID=2552189 RepID=UPI001404680D|nr:phosphodiester glycosidase family protein [Jeotgalibacillus sp. S-D1]